MKKFFKNNKGFTLVELIIVIAVMAILTVVVAPQYLQYVEKSRIGTDENAIGELQHIVEISYVEVAAADKTDKTVIIAIEDDGDIKYTGESEELDKIVKEVYPAGAYKFKSNKYTTDVTGDYVIRFTVDESTGIATVAHNPAA